MKPGDQIPEHIDEVLQLLTVPVTVVGATADGVSGGLTAAWIMRASVDPPLLVVAVGHERFTLGLLARASEFTVSVLAEGQVPEARLFGLHSRRDRDKWSEVDHVLLGEGTPALTCCVARCLCRVEDRFPAGDHDLIVGRVTAAEVVDAGPVLPMRGADYAPETA